MSLPALKNLPEVLEQLEIWWLSLPRHLFYNVFSLSQVFTNYSCSLDMALSSWKRPLQSGKKCFIIRTDLHLFPFILSLWSFVKLIQDSKLSLRSILNHLLPFCFLPICSFRLNNILCNCFITTGLQS